MNFWEQRIIQKITEKFGKGESLLKNLQRFNWQFSNFPWTVLSKGKTCNKFNPVQNTNPWGKARPQHWELCAPLFSISVWVLYCPLLTITTHHELSLNWASRKWGEISLKYHFKQNFFEKLRIPGILSKLACISFAQYCKSLKYQDGLEPVWCHGNKTVVLTLWSTFRGIYPQKVKYFWYKLLLRYLSSSCLIKNLVELMTSSLG